MLGVTQLLRACAGFTLRSDCFSKAGALPTPARNKWLISQSLHSSRLSWTVTLQQFDEALFFV